MNTANDKRLFWACFFALITTAFGFIIRALIMDDWQQEFGLTETEKGDIFGVGLWPFAISIVLFSLVLDRVGYGRSMVFAFGCHILSAIITICAPLVPDGMVFQKSYAYWTLYIGNFIVALGNGTVEAVINPAVATMFSKEKTKWLNILHAGWPGGLVLGGILTVFLAAFGAPGLLSGFPVVGWQVKVALIFLPTVIYGVMMLGCQFPVSETVEAGVPYKATLQEAGILGASVVIGLIVRQLGVVFGIPWATQIGIALALIVAFGVYTRALGRPMFFFLLLIMIPLATTELGTDSWITDLLKPAMSRLNLHPGWILIWTSFIMMVLRFCAGPIVHRISPLGLLAVSAFIAALGLAALSVSPGLLILLAATVYGFGKTFFWPTMLGVVAEQFPKGGALTLNSIAGVGMISVGVLGAPILGNIQDRQIDQRLAKENPTLHAKVISEPKMSVIGEYRAVDQDKLKSEKISKNEKNTIQSVTNAAKRNTLLYVAILPTIMLICYLSLILYFRMKGGYQAQELTSHAAHDEEFTGGVEGPMR